MYYLSSPENSWPRNSGNRDKGYQSDISRNQIAEILVAIKARAEENLFAGLRIALDNVSAEDIQEWVASCGYINLKIKTPQDRSDYA